MGDHYNARACEDLAEFVDHLLFLGSIHSFTPKLGVSPRLMYAPVARGVGSMMSSEPADARGCPGEIGSNSISGGKLSLQMKAPTVSDKASPYGATNHAV